MRRLLFIGWMLLAVINGRSQEQDVDSLINVFNNQKLTIGGQASLCKEICVFYADNDNDKVLDYSKKGIIFSQKIKDKSMESWFEAAIADSYYASGEMDTALIHYQKSLMLALESDDKEAITIAYSSIGVFYFLQGKNVTALDYYMKALSLSEDTGNKKHGMIILSNIAGVYRSLLDNERAIYYLQKTREIAEELGNQYGMINVYYDLGHIYLEKEEPEEALEYIQKVLELNETVKDKQFEILSLQALSYIYCNGFNEYEKAKKYAEESLLIAEKANNQRLVRYAWIALSDIYLQNKEYPECEFAALKAWDIDSLDLGQGRSITQNIMIANAFMGNESKVSRFFIKNHKLNTEYVNKNLHEAIADYEVKYETQKKEIRIASLEKERQLYIWLSITGILFAVTLIIVLWQTKRNAWREKQLIATRSVLDGEMRERTRLAHDLHDRLSGNLSAVKIELGNHMEFLSGIHEKIDNCIIDIRNTAHDLMPVSLQFGIKVALEDFAAQFPNVHFHFFGKEKSVGERMEFVIYCCANELVNNSIKHSGAESINLQLVQDEKYVTLTVSDNGCGFDEKNITKGLGMRSICDRVASCNGKMDISTSPGKGTEITIELRTDQA